MKITKQIRLVISSFLFLILSLGVLFSRVAANAQTSSRSTNLEGTSWLAKPFGMVNLDASVTVITFTYIFDKQGKVTHRVFISKGIGMESQSVLSTPYYDPSDTSGRQLRERRLVLTSPSAGSSEEVGTYRLFGNRIYLEFPDRTISATIDGVLMKGIVTYKGTNKKEEWIIERETNRNNSASRVARAANPNGLSTSNRFEKYKPMPLTTNVISGQLQPGREGVRNFHYTFMAGPGELTLNLVLESSPQSKFNVMDIRLFDNNEQLLGQVSGHANVGRTDQKVMRINIPSRQLVLLRIDEGISLGPAKYRIQLGGTFEAGIGQERLSNRSDSSVAGNVMDNGDRQEAKTLLAQADDLMTQKKYHEAIGIFSKVIQINPDTKETLILAYIKRAWAKLELQDYNGAIEDSSSAIELSIPLKMYYDEQNKKKVGLKSSKKDIITETAEMLSMSPEESAAAGGLELGYRLRAFAKNKLGDKAGACADYRLLCLLISDSSCEEAKEFCK